MDPATVIVVLATHLICTGGLLHLVGRQMPPRCGLQPWASGLMLFGGAYLARLAAGPEAPWPVALAGDVTMLAAAGSFAIGLGQFVGKRAFDYRRAAGLLVLYAATEAALIAQWGAVARHATLNIGLGLTYGWLAGSAIAARADVPRVLRPPLALLSLLIGLLAVLTFARGLHIAVQGMGAVLGGSFAKVYYGYASLAAVLLAMSLLWMVFVRLNAQLAELATHDALTRVLNRAGLDEALRRHYGTRDRVPLTLIAVDVDHFKRINDQHGHPAGDRLLRAIADTLVKHVRPNDLVVRTGGEEFLVCSTAADRAAVLALAERLRSAVAAMTIEGDDASAALRCTVSMGVSGPCATAAEFEAAAVAADRALYAAKSAGRDRVATA